jgi:hypothetical protein
MSRLTALPCLRMASVEPWVDASAARSPTKLGSSSSNVEGTDTVFGDASTLQMAPGVYRLVRR